MQYLAIIKLVLSLLPLIIDAVKAIESAFPASGQGAAKLALIKETIQQAYDAGNGAVAKFDEVWPTLQKTVASVVAFMNSTGAFKK